MTVADIEKTITQHAGESEQDLTDDLYIAVRKALEDGVPRDAVQADLHAAYASFKRSGQRKHRRVVGFVLAYLDGSCSPTAAL
jgi:hypothetical protein